MRVAPLLMFATACSAAYRPPAPPPPAPRFSLAAQEQRDPELCRRMADWDCLELDCPDCEKEAGRARAHDIVEIVGTIAAVAVAAVAGAHDATPRSEHVGWAHTWADSTIEACQKTCRRCAATKALCRP